MTDRSPQQAWALKRLGRFLTLRILNPEAEAQYIMLMKLAAYSAYRDCVSLGLQKEADDLLQNRRVMDAIVT